MTTLILIRHGESESNRQGIFAGQINPDLQNRGLKQAELTAKYITDNYKVDKIYSSDLQRAYKTATCLADILGMEVTTEKNLREINAGKWEGMKFDDLVLKYEKDYNIWLSSISDAVCPEGESVRQMGKRVIAALTKIAEENHGKTVVIATHGTPIRAMQSFVRCTTFDEMKNIPWVSNASVSVFEYNDNTWKEIMVSEDKHLAELKTVLPQNA